MRWEGLTNFINLYPKVKVNQSMYVFSGLVLDFQTKYLTCFSLTGELHPHLPGYTAGSHDSHSSQVLLPLTFGGGGCNPDLPVALRSTERVTQEAEELLTTFTSETLRNNRLEVPHWMLAMPRCVCVCACVCVCVCVSVSGRCSLMLTSVVL